jgi:hypothetical protein
MQARWGTHGDHSIVALTASNHQDVFAMTVEAFNIAEDLPHAGGAVVRRGDRSHARAAGDS